MTRPNTFLLGAPKCGTTSLAAWLAEHPDVFVSVPKEPAYFCPRYGAHMSEAGYLGLFSRAGDAAIRIDASTQYLRSPDAIRAINAFDPEARFIVMARNPVDMVAAWHEQMIFNAAEDLTDLRVAWDAMPARRRGEQIPPNCAFPENLDYRAVCALGTQISRLLTLVASERVALFLLDDFKEDARTAYRAVLSFLDLPDDGRTKFPVANASKAPRSIIAARVISGLGALKRRTGIASSTGLLSRASMANRIERQRKPSSDELISEMAETFAEEVMLLEQTFARDLSGWEKARVSPGRYAESRVEHAPRDAG